MAAQNIYVGSRDTQRSDHTGSSGQNLGAVNKNASLTRENPLADRHILVADRESQSNRATILANKTPAREHFAYKLV
jgi:hypothetical protein